jgi:ribulose 1,5-bisphosphate carboxylase large subunit-like protein
VNIPQLLAIAWLPAEYERTSHVWIEDICLPPALLATIPGPHLGAAGLYASVRRAPGSPILQGILKPRFGGDLDRFLRSAEEALLAGLHGLVDDELMNDPQSEFSFSRRLKRCADVTRKAEKKTGQPKHYIPSIIAPLREAESSIAMVAAEGLPGFMTNSFALGYAGFQYLCEVAREKGLFVVDCSIGATLMSLPSERTGTSMELLAKLSRYSGADGAHTGSEGEHWYSSSILRQLLTALQGNIADIKPTLPVVAGEVNMANIWTKLRPFGGSCVVNVGAGFWHHPERPAKAVAQTLSALNCASLDSPAEEAQDALNKLCGKDPAFARAMDHFGYGQVDNAR